MFTQHGITIGGTSAGTACQTELMLTGKGNMKVLKSKNIELVRGLELLPNVLIDQHFIERNRQNRLISVVLEYPKLLGIGVGEGTSIWVNSNSILKVIGDGWVQLYDASNSKIVHGNDNNIGGSNLKMHILQNNESFNLTSKLMI